MLHLIRLQVHSELNLDLCQVITYIAHKKRRNLSVPQRYENPIDTFEELDKSGLPLLTPANTAIYALLATDPRPVLKRIHAKSKGQEYPMNKGWPKEITDK